jgi:hypothetical protein
MRGVKFFQASGFPLNGAGEFIGGAGSTKGRELRASGNEANGGQRCLSNAAHPTCGTLSSPAGYGRSCGNGGRLATALSLSLPLVVHAEGAAPGNLFAGSNAHFFWLALVGCFVMIVSMLSDPQSQQILWKGLRRCAVVVLAALIVGGAAFLNVSLFELVLLAIAPWICFVVLLWGFITSGLSDWDKP